MFRGFLLTFLLSEFVRNVLDRKILYFVSSLYAKKNFNNVDKEKPKKKTKQFLRDVILVRKYPAAVIWFGYKEKSTSKDSDGPMWVPTEENKVPRISYPPEEEQKDIISRNSLYDLQVQFKNNTEHLMGDIAFMTTYCVCLFNYKPQVSSGKSKKSQLLDDTESENEEEKNQSSEPVFKFDVKIDSDDEALSKRCIPKDSTTSKKDDSGKPKNKPVQKGETKNNPEVSKQSEIPKDTPKSEQIGEEDEPKSGETPNDPNPKPKEPNHLEFKKVHVYQEKLAEYKILLAKWNEDQQKKKTGGS